ncbi:hypothetical protein VX159_05730 [Dechloromonas sp. ZY10]|uniref:hypothetical protein n=1 Tax=Dechloromonas aquae TaxID=2664436 RepID=UPI003527293B
MKNALSRWLISIAMLLLGGCGMTVTWQEEVQLSDGRVIVVERETVRVSGGDDLAHGGSGSTPKERRIRFEFPLGSGQRVEWRSSKSDSRQFPESPLVLDIVAEQPVILTINPISEGCEVYSKYSFQNGSWIKEKLPDAFAKQATNLYLKSGPSMPSFVDIATKNRDNADIRYFRTLKQVGPRRVICSG